MKGFFDDRDQQCWIVTLDCIQQPDDSKENNKEENHFKLQMAKVPGGGWYIRFLGEIALSADEIPLLLSDLQGIADALKWGKP